ncbi:HNH endonuclease [Phanerochaete sordida]|uniref:HNH endonuclease n=1 Tax=Phanerochaete sordida TaxID=48140 RepID=A0A9P3G731_9APHY|nr:HNH endonuclease [Phanerochaete sordida]
MTTGINLSRPRPALPSGDIFPEPLHSVEILHPAARSGTPLLYLAAYDRIGEGSWGVCYNVVLEAASFIANNAEGYLSRTPGPDGRVDRVAVLEAGRYFYCVASAEATWPVVGTFDAWRFPDRIPSRWSAAIAPNITFPSASASAYSPERMAGAVLARDRRCILTGFERSLESCYIVPQSEAQWFSANRMWLYMRHNVDNATRFGPDLVNDAPNGLTLRRDIRMEFDAGAFAFVVKGDGVVCYYLAPSTQYPELYHNVGVAVPVDVPPELLYARFALAVVRQIQPTALHGLPRGLGAQRESPNAGYPRKKRKMGSTPPSVDPDTAESSGIGDHSVGRTDENPAGPAEQRALIQLGEEEASRVTAAEFFKRLPHLRREVSYSDDDHWQNLVYHPEIAKMERLRRDWLQTHPNVSAMSAYSADGGPDEISDEVDDGGCDEVQ